MQEWHGSFNPSFLTDDGELSDNAFELDFHIEHALKFECSCGQKYRSTEDVTEHMLEQVNDDE